VVGPPCPRILSYWSTGTPFTYSANRPQTTVGDSPELSGRDRCWISAVPLVGSTVVFSPECKRIMKAARIHLVISLTRLSTNVSSGMAESPEASLEYGRIRNRGQLHCLESVIDDVVSTRNGKWSELNEKQLVKCLSRTRFLVSTISTISNWALNRLGEQWEWSFHIYYIKKELSSAESRRSEHFYEKTGFSL
jgi:hypothetical protein